MPVADDNDLTRKQFADDIAGAISRDLGGHLSSINDLLKQMHTDSMSRNDITEEEDSENSKNLKEFQDEQIALLKEIVALSQEGHKESEHKENHNSWLHDLLGRTKDNNTRDRHHNSKNDLYMQEMERLLAEKEQVSKSDYQNILKRYSDRRPSVLGRTLGLVGSPIGVSTLAAGGIAYGGESLLEHRTSYASQMTSHGSIDTASNVGAGALEGAMSGASTGALLGSIVPGVGTGVGAAIGGAMGAAEGGLRSYMAEYHITFTDLGKMLAKKAGELKNWTSQELESLGKWASAQWESFRNGIGKSVVNSIDSIMDFILDHIPGSRAVLSSIRDKISSGAKNLSEKAEDLIGGIYTNLGNDASTAVKNAEDAAKDAVEGRNKYEEWLKNTPFFKAINSFGEQLVSQVMNPVSNNVIGNVTHDFTTHSGMQFINSPATNMAAGGINTAAITERTTANAVSGNGTSTPIHARLDGISDSYMQHVAMIESGGHANAHATGTSAYGLYQFTTGAWKDTLARHPELTSKYGIGPGDRGDPDKAQIVESYYAMDSKNLLNKEFGNVSDSQLYAAHIFGNTGGSNFLRAEKSNPNQSIRSVFGDKVISNNHLYHKDGSYMSVGEVQGMFDRKFGVNSAISTNAIGERDTSNAVSTPSMPVATGNEAGGMPAAMSLQAMFKNFTDVIKKRDEEHKQALKEARVSVDKNGQSHVHHPLSWETIPMYTLKNLLQHTNTGHDA